MLLSIVKCSDYQKSQGWKQQVLPIVRQSGFEVIGPVKGPNVAIMRNKGAKAASGRWLFFKDPDCKVDVERLQQLCRQLETQGQVVVLGGIYKNRSSKPLAQIYHHIQRTWVLRGLCSIKDQTFLREASQLLGGALLIKKQEFLELGGFNEDIGWGGEELELVERARAAGYSTKMSYRLVIEHENSLSLLGFFKRAWKQNYNRASHGFGQIQKTESWEHRSYFLIKATQLPWVLLFFTVGAIALSCGSATRLWGRK